MINLFGRNHSLCVILATIILALAGCSKHEPTAQQPAANNAVFASASAELKQHWQTAQDLAAKKNYSDAVTHLLAIANSSSTLSQEQLAAFHQLWSDFGTQLFGAASAGDKAAVEALKQMKVSKFGNPEGR
jgi:hypothetical protein